MGFLVSVQNPTSAVLTDVPVFIEIPELTSDDYTVRINETELLAERVSRTAYWVLIPELGLSGIDDILFLRNPTETGAGDSMWADFEAVIHFDETSVDSSPNERNGMVDVGTTNGVFDQAADFQTFTEIEFKGYDGMNVNDGELSVEFWAIPREAGRLLDLRGSCVGPVFTFSTEENYGSQFDADELCGEEPPLSTQRVTGTFDGSSWTYFVLTFSRNDGTMAVIVNGNDAGRMSLPSELISAEEVEPIEIGGDSENPFLGILDEFRISRRIRTPEWYEFQYEMGTSEIYQVTESK